MKICYSLIFSLFICVAGAQDFVEIANAGYGLGTANSYSSFTRYNFGVKIPVLLDKEKTNIILVSFSGSQSDAEDENSLMYQLGNITFNPAYVRRLSDKHSLTLMAFTRWNGTNLGFGSDDFQLGGLIIWDIKKNENYTYRLGFYANDELFGTFVTPFFGLDWKISDRLRFYGNLPILFTLAYSINDRIDIGLDYFGLISSFRQANTYVERRVLNLGPYADFYIMKQLVFRAHAGYLLGSSLNEFALGDQVGWALNLIKFRDNRTELSNIDVTGMFFTASLSFRIKTK